MKTTTPIDPTRALADRVRDAVVCIDSDDQIVWANAPAWALLEIAPLASNSTVRGEGVALRVRTSAGETIAGWRASLAHLRDLDAPATVSVGRSQTAFEGAMSPAGDQWLLTLVRTDLDPGNDGRTDLNESDSLYQSLVTHVPGAFYRCDHDPDWTMQYISDAIEGITGYPAAEFIQNRVRTYTSVIHPDDVASVDAAVAAKVSERLPFHLSYRVIHRDGDILWVEESGAGVFDDNQNLLFLDGFIQDTTLLHTASARLRDSEAAERTARLNAEAAFLEVQSYRAALDTHAMVVVADVHGRILRANPKFLNRFGYAAEELVGRSYRVLDVRPENDSYTHEIAEAVATGAIWQGELVVRTKQGERFWIGITLVPITDSITKELQQVGFLEDITARKLSERRRYEEHQRLQLALEGGDLGLWDWDVVTNAVAYDERWAAMLGEDLADLAPDLSTWESRVHPEDLADAMSRIETVTRDGGDRYEWTGRMRHKDGSWRWILARGGVVSRDNDGRMTRMVGTHADVTTYVKIRQDLTDQVTKLEIAEVQARMGHWSWDRASGDIRWSNNLFALHDRPIALGMPNYQEMLDCFDAEGKATLAAAVQRSMTTLEPYRVRIRSARRAVQWIECDARVVTDEDGQFAGLLGTCMDITERVVGEEALRAAMARVEAATRAKSEFLANMSHEIRSPLTAILGYAEILRDDHATHGSDAGQIRAANTIIRAGHHLLALINDILDLSKIEAGRMTLDAVETHIADIFRDVVSLTLPRTTEKGLRLSVIARTQLPASIYGDPKRVRQILMNLVGNAVKFTDSGHVDLTVAQEPPDDPAWLVIDVADTGVGIDADDAARLFDAFSQVDGSSSRRHEGTGLGLNICRRLAGLMGGSVRLLWSDPGRGSCFRVELPLRPVPGTRLLDTNVSLLPEGAQLDAPILEQETPRLSGRVLVVDDGETNQTLFRLHLERAGAEVVTADDGRSALDIYHRAVASNAPFDLILTDIQMPEMDGYELARALRATGCVTPIMALTAHAMAEDRRRCLEAGCDDYISKPVDKTSLVRRCAMWLGRRSHVNRSTR